MITIKKYIPAASPEQVFAYRPDDPATHTPSSVVNAVAEALYSTKIIQCKDLADYLGIGNVNHLASAILLDTGVTLQNLIHKYRIQQALAYMKAHSEANQDEVAHLIGYANGGSLWRLFQRKEGITPTGKKSHAGPELWLEYRKKLQAISFGRN